MNRRDFLENSKNFSLIALACLGGVPLNSYAATVSDEIIAQKSELIFHNKRPLNAEALVSNLNDHLTPYKDIFIRNNGLLPDSIDLHDWQLKIDGESVIEAKTFTMADLEKFEEVSVEMVLECGGNGRSEFFPSTKGNQWNTGAVACMKWTGVRLSDVLNACGIKKDAVYVGFYGADKHLSGDPKKSPISRGCPIEKALDEHTMLAYKMNDEAIPLAHGYPLRLIVPGYPGSASGKWINKLVIRNKVHDGEKMVGNAYRIPRYPVHPGEEVKPDDMKIIEEMPVKSIITFPASGLKIHQGSSLRISGHAWSGHGEVKAVFISKDYGVTWHEAKLNQAKHIYQWQRFNYEMPFEERGYYEVWARAVDRFGRTQPLVMPGWNPKGYLNNAAHRIAVNVDPKDA